jgi:hypothetical protein
MNGWPSKLSFGTFSADGNSIQLEECVITHEGVFPA